MDILPALGNKKYLYGFVAFVAAISLLAVFGEKGLIDMYRLKEERDGMINYNAELDDENQRLAEEIELLKTDKRYMARIARSELGMIGEREVLYILED